MKKTIYKLAVSMLIACTIFTACNSSNKKAEEAKNKIQAAKDSVAAAAKEFEKNMKD